ncbi:MAG: hypothetical protein IIC27_06135 [Chloroflexi bacterium]|nr:hypothetical protein [Chloroflexota bacterium]
MDKEPTHTQETDSAGRLAGGIAHDFNNYLTSMIINTELALMTLPPDHPAREHLFEIHKWSVARIDKWLAGLADVDLEEYQDKYGQG